MDKELKSLIQQLVDSQHKVIQSNAELQDDISSLTATMSSRPRRDDDFSGGSFNPRIATPMLPGGFRAFIGAASGVNFLKKLIANSVQLGTRQGFGETFGDMKLSRQLMSPEQRQKREDLLTRARLGQLTKQEKRKDPALIQLKDQFERSTEYQETYDKTYSLNQQQADQKKLTEQFEKYTDMFAGKTATGRVLATKAKTALESGDFETAKTAIENFTKFKTTSATRGGTIEETNDAGEQLAETLKRINDKSNELPQALDDLAKQAAEEQAGREQNLTITKVLGTRFLALAIGVVTVTKGLTTLSKVVQGFQQELGGVSSLQALENRLDVFNQFFSLRTLKSLAPGGEAFVPQEFVIQAQGAVAKEFGRQVSTEVGLALAEGALRRGIGIDQYVDLTRALQGLTIDSESALQQFAESGIVAGVATDEMIASADAIARAGSQFNEFIVQGIVNTRKLGLEFNKIEQTLTGYSMDFEGTVDAFAQLRSVIPGFEVDLNELLSTALYGSPDELIELVRSGLMGAGITTVEGMGRQQLGILEDATGFGAAEIGRILSGEGESQIEQNAMQLDKTRNDHLMDISSKMDTLALVLGASIAAGGLTTAIARRAVGSGRISGRLRNIFKARGAEKISEDPLEVLQAAQGGGAVASSRSAARNVGKRGLARGLGKGLLRKAGPIGLLLSLSDALGGFRADPTAGFGGSIMNAGSSVLSGFSFGLLGSSPQQIAARSPGGSSYAQNTMRDQPVARTTMDRQVSNDIKALGVKVDELKTVWERGITAEMRGVDRVILSIQDADRRRVNA